MGATAGHGDGSEGPGPPSLDATEAVDAGSSEEAGEIFDVGHGDPAGEDGGCNKIDFLFVIDNSTSMTSHQDALVASFPEFIAAIQATLPDGDFHIMVVDSDDDPVNFCEDGCDEGGEPLHHLCEAYNCGSEDAADECDLTIGAGVVHPIGGLASNVPCEVPPGRRFVDSTHPDLSATFACMARVGVSGAGNERNVTSLLDALTLHAQPGGCNDGFLRDDAILVVTMVTNADAGTAYTELNGGPEIEAWQDTLVAAKAGNEEAIVLIGFVKDDELPPTGVKYGDFVRLFGERGYVEHVFTDDYGALFAEAIDGIEQACDDFEPAG
jgi:hypothetical protein